MAKQYAVPLCIVAMALSFTTASLGEPNLSSQQDVTRNHSNEQDMLILDANTGRLYSPKMDAAFADRPYQYALSGSAGGESFSDVGLTERTCKRNGGETVVTGRFAKANVALVQAFSELERHLEETITLKNTGTEPVVINDVEIGFVADITDRPDWRLCAIPFRVQLDGSVHDYSTEALINGEFSNAVYSDRTRPEPPLTEEGRLRSEAWAWWNGERGLVIIKYNNEAIELSVASPRKQGGKRELRFGGAGFCLYGEPSTARNLAQGEQVTFGTTLYVPFEGGLNQAFECYRDFLDSKGHTFPEDYNPPVNWNELYDIGWYHSNKKYLKERYTREVLLREAEKAKECSCELLYLDPGWEVVEGTTLWDESRLGTVPDLVRTLKEEYGLDLGYRTILRCYREHWQNEYLVKHPDREQGPVRWPGQKMWEPCLCYPKFQQEKLRRILDISKHGIRFMMFDEMDWRGPCHDASHGHAVPTTPLDHIRAVYDLCNEVRKRCPGLIVEAHDPVWPWHTAIYAPTYFNQGFGDNGSYDENWGFEYMWDCIDDLRSGKALALYYYNLGCNIPLYLHITMAADNDNCLFFWWAASTIRHLGIGGKESHRSVEPRGGLPPYDPEERFAAYQKQMKIYQRLKPYFVRGRFHGLAENIHLHTLQGVQGGVVTVFNISDAKQSFRFSIARELLGENPEMAVKGAEAKWTADGVELRLSLPALSPGLVCIGDSVRDGGR